MTFWSNKYIGIPFAEEGRGFAGCDCAGLVDLVLREEKGVQVTRFGYEYARLDFKGKKGLRELETALRKHLLAEWPKAVSEPRPFDAVIFALDGIECHVGIYVGGGQFLHVEKNGLFAKIDELSDPKWTKCFVEFRRHKSLGGNANSPEGDAQNLEGRA